MTNSFSPDLDVCVNIPYSSDYTESTQNLYTRLFQIEPNADNFYDDICPFAYDCGDKIGMMSTLNAASTNYRQLFIELNPAIPAALSTNSLDPLTGRPRFGNYVFCYTQGPIMIPNIIAFRRKLIGAIQTLPNGADIPFRMGKYSWTGITQYAILVNYWEHYLVNNLQLATTMSVQSLALSNNSKFGYNEFVYSVAIIDNQFYLPTFIPVHMQDLNLNYF